MTRFSQFVVPVALGGAALVVLALTTNAPGQCTATEQFKLAPSDGEPADHFGRGVAIDGTVAVVGAWYDDDADPGDPDCNSGSAYVFRYDLLTDDWVEEQKLTAFDAECTDWYGFSVAVEGDLIAIGSYIDSHDLVGGSRDSAGSVYLYRYDPLLQSWEFEQQLYASNANTNDNFGTSVDISGDRVVVGAEGRNGAAGNNTGGVYVYRYDDITGLWYEEDQPVSLEGWAGANMGRSVSIDGEIVAAGAPFDDTNCPPETHCSHGAVHVFRYDEIGGSWYEEVKLYGPSPDTDDYGYFGDSVSVQANTLLIGAPGADTGTGYGGKGGVYVYEFVGDPPEWQHDDTIDPPDPDETGDFGGSVAQDGERCVIGAYGDDHGTGYNTGAAHLFRYDSGLDTWNHESKLLATGAADWDNFGEWVGLSGSNTIVGGPGNRNQSSIVGFACIYNGLVDCNSNGVLDMCDIADGTSLDDNLNGVPDECETGCVAHELSKGRGSDTGTDDLFGESVAASELHLLAGAPRHNGHIGAVYAMKFNGSAMEEDRKIVAGDGVPGDSFGYAIDVDGYDLVIGADQLGHFAPADGAVYVYHWNLFNYVFEAKLQPPPSFPDLLGAAFGLAVSIHDDVIAVGAPYYDLDDVGDSGEANQWLGSAFVYRWNSTLQDWVQEAWLTPPDGALRTYYGLAMAVYGDWLVVGAPYADDPGAPGSATEHGLVYLYRYDSMLTTWFLDDVLESPVPTDGYRFGTGIDMQGNRLAISAVGSGGRVFMYRLVDDRWQLEEKLRPSDTVGGDRFGEHVCLEANRLVASAPGHGAQGLGSGAAYVFRYRGDHAMGHRWREEAKLMPSDPQDNHNFNAVALWGHDVIVGASSDDEIGDNAGAGYGWRGISDCDANGWLDQCDMVNDPGLDGNGNGVIDTCEGPCPGDVTGDGAVDTDDFLMVLANWGICPEPCPPYCDGDATDDCEVNTDDFLAVLANWGPCL